MPFLFIFIKYFTYITSCIIWLDLLLGDLKHNFKIMSLSFFFLEVKIHINNTFRLQGLSKAAYSAFAGKYHSQKYYPGGKRVFTVQLQVQKIQRQKFNKFIPEFYFTIITLEEFLFSLTLLRTNILVQVFPTRGRFILDVIMAGFK